MSRMRWMAMLGVAVMASSCSTMRPEKVSPLRVGVTPNYPPVIMLRGEKAAGVECDFAVRLASELGRPLMLIPVPWELQLEELEAGRIDIVMSGMTVTPARQARAAFCDGYMDNPLIAVVRRGGAGAYSTKESVLGAGGGLGVLRESSADAFARRACKNAKILPLSTREDVAFYLANQRIDLYIDDLAAAVGIVSRHEERLELVPLFLEPQTLAWAVRRDDEALRNRANEVLARWRADGWLEQVLERWMPHLQMATDGAGD